MISVVVSTWLFQSIEGIQTLVRLLAVECESCCDAVISVMSASLISSSEPSRFQRQSSFHDRTGPLRRPPSMATTTLSTFTPITSFNLSNTFTQKSYEPCIKTVRSLSSRIVHSDSQNIHHSSDTIIFLTLPRISWTNCIHLPRTSRLYLHPSYSWEEARMGWPQHKQWPFLESWRAPPAIPSPPPFLLSEFHPPPTPPHQRLSLNSPAHPQRSQLQHPLLREIHHLSRLSPKGVSHS